MTNIARGEISLDVPFNKERTDHFVLKFTNAGHRAMEDFLNMESSEILWRINSGRVGARVVTGLFWGATRKFHSDEFPSVDDVDGYMDEIDEEAEDGNEAAQNLLVGLIAAYTKSNPSEIEAVLMGEENNKTSDGEAIPKGRGKAAPKSPAKRSTKKPSKSDESDSGESS